MPLQSKVLQHDVIHALYEMYGGDESQVAAWMTAYYTTKAGKAELADSPHARRRPEEVVADILAGPEYDQYRTMSTSGGGRPR